MNLNDASSPLSKLRALPFMKGLDNQLVTSLADGLIYKQVPANTVLFRPMDPVRFCFILSYGSLKIVRMSPQQREIVMGFYRAGDIVGVVLMPLAAKYHIGTAMTLEDSGLLMTPVKAFTNVWLKSPELFERLQSKALSTVQEMLEDKLLAASSIPQRIAGFLLRMIDSQPKNLGSRLNMRLTRKDIADRLGTSVETVIRILSQWSSQGWVRTVDRYIEITDREALENILRV